MNAGHRTRRALPVLTALLAACLLLAGQARAEMVRELVSINDALPLTVSGVGIITGLTNTGDKKDAALSLMREHLSKSGIALDVSSLATGNIAIVHVTGEIPPLARPGSQFDVTVTSFGDAKSLAGGQLWMCELYTGEGEFMGTASGQVVTGSSALTRGTIPVGSNSGGRLLGVYPFGRVVDEEGFIRLNLNQPNWNDASSIARQINQTPSLNPNLTETVLFADAVPPPPVAFAKDMGQVLVRIPEQYRYEVTRYISDILDVPIAINQPATIVINRARNSIVVTGDVRVNNAMVSLQDKTVTIRPETPEEPAAYALQADTPRTAVEIDGPGSYADLQSLIDTLNAMGLSTQQVIAVFEELKTSGAIRANFINQ